MNAVHPRTPPRGIYAAGRPGPGLLLAIALAAGIIAAPVAAQLDPAVIERLRRDQDEILRKAERLTGLMERLQQRFLREGKKEQVEYLREGLDYLRKSDLLRDVATIRDDLESAAFTEALRKQRAVVEDLERLLNILLARKSVENLDEQLAQVRAQASSARQLERRQAGLIDATRAAASGEQSPAEQELAERLTGLREAERREAERNSREAGVRRPFLESALERVENLLRRQDLLDRGIADEAAGRNQSLRAQEFDLGELNQQVRELAGAVRDQRRQGELATAAAALQRAAEGGDAQSLQQAREQFELLLQNPPRRSAGSQPEGASRDPDWSALRERARRTPDAPTAAARDELAALGQESAALGAARSEEAAAANQATSSRLAQRATDLAGRLQPASPPDGGADNTAQAAVRQAAEHLEAAAAASGRGEAAEAQRQVDRAQSALDQARARHRQENPDAARNAAEMAAESLATAQELQNSPTPETAEQRSAAALRAAAQAQRAVESAVAAARDGGAQADAGAEAAESRAQLENARATLQQALAQANAASGPELAAAAARQRDLEQALARAGEQLDRAAAAGQLTAAQRDAAARQLDAARSAMQAAAQRLEQGQQASGAAAQRAAADALQQAVEALRQNRPLGEQQREQLRAEAQQQQQLTEDIIRLAEELRKRDNKAAQRAAERATESSQRAQRALDQGEADEALEQQQQARDQLRETAEQLEEEQDRYQDLRQEELLFRMKEELAALLERQRPITAATLEVQRTTGAGNLSRPARLKLNQLGEEEQALAGKLEFLINALTEEGNLVYHAVLNASLEDLREIARRLGARAPDYGPFTTLLQQDVERRTEQLMAALDRERQRREQERQQSQQQERGQNRFNPQREALVSLIAELEMLKQLDLDTRRATEDLRTLIELRADESITPAEVAMIQRLAHRHQEITSLFQQIKKNVETTLQAMQDQDDEDDPGRRPGRRR